MGRSYRIGAFLWIAIACAVVTASSGEALAANPTCLGKRATIQGTNDGETLKGTKHADVIVAKGGEDDIVGKGGDDRICAGSGDDAINAGPGTDRIDAGNGIDLCIADDSDRPPVNCEPEIESVVLPPGLEEGTSGTGTVTLEGPAPPGGQKASLSSTEPSRVFVPANVTVPEGHDHVDFAIQVTDGPAIGSVEIDATSGRSVVGGTFQIFNAVELETLTLTRPCLYVGESQSVVGTIGLDQAVDSNTFVAIASDTPSVATVANNGSTVPQGMSTAPVFVSTLSAGTATLTATLNDRQRTALLTVRSPAYTPVLKPEPLGITPNPVTAGSSAIGTVVIDCEAHAGGSIVSLSSSNANVTVPSSVTVPAGQTSATFSISTAAPAAGQTSTITATLGDAQNSAVLSVSAP